MKVAYCSDLHLEFESIDPQELLSDADVLILAGDIVLIKYIVNATRDADNDPADIINFFDTLTGAYKHIIWIMGNHEYYRSDLADIDELKRSLQSYTNLHILNNEAIMIDDVKFIGGTMWTDLNEQDPMTVLYAPSMLNDFRVIRDHGARFSAGSWLQMHYEFLTMLHKEITERCVVVTHHSPAKKTILPRYADAYEMNGLYVSRLEELILRNDIKLWIHGHLHCAPTIDVGENNIVTSNTRGYPHESCFSTFEIKVVDVF
jgi:Icc-related predicted phosphoesterase